MIEDDNNINTLNFENRKNYLCFKTSAEDDTSRF